MGKDYQEMKIIEDPCFYQYTPVKELNTLNTSELTIALSVLRKEQRRLKEKVFRSFPKDPLYKSNLRLLNRRRKDVEELLFIKQGYIPDVITQNMIDTLIKNNRKSILKMKNR